MVKCTGVLTTSGYCCSKGPCTCSWAACERAHNTCPKQLANTGSMQFGRTQLCPLRIAPVPRCSPQPLARGIHTGRAAPYRGSLTQCACSGYHMQHILILATNPSLRVKAGEDWKSQCPAYKEIHRTGSCSRSRFHRCMKKPTRNRSQARPPPAALPTGPGRARGARSPTRPPRACAGTRRAPCAPWCAPACTKRLSHAPQQGTRFQSLSSDGQKDMILSAASCAMHAPACAPSGLHACTRRTMSATACSALCGQR